MMFEGVPVELELLERLVLDVEEPLAIPKGAEHLMKKKCHVIIHYN